MSTPLTTRLRRLFRPARCRPIRRTRLGLEPLDPRIAPAIISIIPSCPTLQVISDDAPDNVEVRVLGPAGANGFVMGVLRDAVLFAAVPIACPPNIPITAVANIVFIGNGGDDTFRNSTPFPSAQTGGPGNDVLIGGTSTDTVVETGNVNFRLTNTRLDGLGSDALTNIESARLTGGPAANTLDASNFTGSVTLDGAAGADVLLGGTGNDVLIPGSGNDDLNGDGGSNQVREQFSGTITLTNRSLVSIQGTDNLINIQTARLTGSGGPDILDASDFTNGSVTLNGEAGNDLLQGGGRNDVLNGGPGDDLLMRSGGTDELNGDDGIDNIFGLVRRRLTRDELRQEGNMRAALVGDTLTVAGPSGAGFEIVGAWVIAAGPPLTFTASGDLILKTAGGNLTVAAGPLPLRFTVAADFTNSGQVTNVNWNSVIGLSNSEATGLNNFLREYGLSVTLPSVAWGVNLGRDLGSLGAPLNGAVPYLHVNVEGNFTVTSNGQTFSAGLGRVLTVIFDPSDPFIFVHFQTPPPLQEFAYGISMKGHIPFTPQVALPGSFGQPGQQIFGNAFGRGSVNIPVAGVPVTVSGNVVLDLDANDDGVLLNLNVPFSNLFTGLPLPVVDDVRIGANGAAGIGFKFQGFDMTLALAEGTLMYRPGLVAFKATTPEPFANTPLAFLDVDPLFRADIEGFFNSNNGNFFARVAFARGRFLLLPASQQSLEFSNTGVAADIDLINIPGWGIISVAGSINNQGRFSLTGAADSEFPPCLPLPVCITFPAHLSATVSNLGGPLSFTGVASGGVLYETLGVTVRGDVSVGVTFTLVGGGLQASGTGAVTLTACAPVVGCAQVGGTITVSNQGVRVCVNAFGAELCNTFPFPPAFRERTITPQAAAGEPVTITGTIVITEPTKDFFLDVAWGDGTPVETFTFPPGSDGQRVSITHRYAIARRAAASNTYTVALLWRQPNGGSNADVLTVTVTNPPLTETQRYVARLYTDVLGRDADAAGLELWSGLLDRNERNRPQVIAAIQASQEYRTRVVEGLYTQLLGRAADAPGRDAWVQFLAEGGSKDQLEAQLLGSAEYLARAGGSDEGFLNALYKDALDRVIEPAAVPAWQEVLRQGTSRTAVAAVVLNSPERHTRMVQGFYEHYLRRSADPAGLQALGQALGQGMSEQQVLAVILASDEYFSRLEQ